jgi:hypothetical protein
VTSNNIYVNGSHIWSESVEKKLFIARRLPTVIFASYNVSTGAPHWDYSLVEIGSPELFAQAGLKPQSFLISPSQVARITGFSHHACPICHFLLGQFLY